jgi:cell division protein FtsI (penicillin-binding protein 3)
VISKETADLIKELFTGIVDRGTGKAVKINNLKIAGKTGTSQQLVDGTYSKSKYNASFIGFFPVENPQIAMIVVLDNPKGNYYGGTTAAPIFRNIALRIVNSSDVLAKAATTLSPIEITKEKK